MTSTLCIVYAQGEKDGVFLDINFAYNGIGDGFDGESVLVNANNVFAIPEFSSGIGFGLAMGYRYSELYIELAYQRTQHDFNFIGIKGDAVHSIWSFNLRRLLLKNSRLQPFVQIGWLPVMPIRVNEGALLVSENIASDAIFIGDTANFNLGTGLEFEIKPKMAIRFNIFYKRARYLSVENSEENVAIELENAINADAVNLSLGFVLVL